MSSFEFTEDWFTGHVGPWEKIVRPHLRARAELGPLAFLEVGSFEGRSAIWILDNVITRPDDRLMCVDLFIPDDREGRFDRNLQLAGAGGRLVKHKGPSARLLRSLPVDHFDAVYIDGSHFTPDVLRDTVLAWDLLRAGGLMIWDDYFFDGGGLRERPGPAIDAFLALFGDELTTRWRDYQIIVEKRPPLRAL